MRAKRMSAAQAARSFSEILNRVKYRGESFVVERNRQAVCRIEPMAQRQPLTTDNLAKFWKSLPRPDACYIGDLDEVRRLSCKPLGSACRAWRNDRAVRLNYRCHSTRMPDSAGHP